MNISAAPRNPVARSSWKLPSPPPGPRPNLNDRIGSAFTEGIESGATGLAVGAVGAHLGMAAMVHNMGVPVSRALGWVDPTVVTVGALWAGAVTAGIGAVRGATSGENRYHVGLSVDLGLAVGAAAGAATFVQLINLATRGY